MSSVAAFARRALGAIVVAFALATSLTGLCSIWVWQFRWPAHDLWRQYVTLLELPFPDNVLALENGHRPLLPNLVRAFDAWCCGANQSATTLVALALCGLAIAILLRAAWRDERLTFVQRATIALFVALAVFWLGNSRMLVQTSEMLHVQFAFLSLLLGAASLVRAARARPLLWSALAALCATAATFTFGPGIAAFPALLLVAIAVRTPWRGVAVIAFALTAVLWLYLFAMPGDEGVRGNLIIDPLVNLRHALQWLGAPLFTAWLGLTDPVAETSLRDAIVHEWGGDALRRSAQTIATTVPAYGGWLSTSAITGAIGLLAATAIALRTLWLRRPATPLAAMALALVLFGAGIAFVIALARHDLFIVAPGQIFADRYMPWSCLFWLGVGIVAVRALPSRWDTLAGVAAIAVALLAYPSHAVLAGWTEAVSLATARGMTALRFGTWDETVMPWPNEASREQIGRTMAMLRAGNGAIWRDLPDRVRVLPPGNTSSPQLGRLVVVRRIDEAETGRVVLSFEGRTLWPQRSGELLVVDAEGRFRGLALLHGQRDWKRLVRASATDVGIYGYAFDDGCAPLYATVLRGASAQAIARLDPCTAAP